MRINEMITKKKSFDLLSNSLNYIFLGNVQRSIWRIGMLILGLKGLTRFDCNIFKRRLKLTSCSRDSCGKTLRFKIVMCSW